MTIHCTDYKQANKLLDNGWKLMDVRNSTPTKTGFVYILKKAGI